MSDLSKLADHLLIEATDRVVAGEREALILVLEHLREMERRRLFSALGYSSLWDYAVQRLKYSEDQAWRRISAMRMLKELPEIEQQIESGALTLTSLGLAQSWFRCAEKLDKPLARASKSALLKKLENKSKRQAQQIVLKESGEPTLLKPDTVRPISEKHVVVQFTAAPELLEKIERVKGLLAHSHPDLNLANLINKLCDLGLEKLDPARPPKRKTPPAPARVTKSIGNQGRGRRRCISSALKREIWSKSGGRCENCGSQHALQIEHLLPVAKGGGNEVHNLAMLCRSCNQRAAIEMFGVEKMDPYLSPPPV